MVRQHHQQGNLYRQTYIESCRLSDAAVIVIPRKRDPKVLENAEYAASGPRQPAQLVPAGRRPLGDLARPVRVAASARCRNCAPCSARQR